MNPIVKSLLEFNQAFEIPKLDTPNLGPEELIELRIKLLEEEVKEYAEAARAGDLVEVLDALADIGYILAGTIINTACSTSTMMHSMKCIVRTWRSWLTAKSCEGKMGKC